MHLLGANVRHGCVMVVQSTFTSLAELNFGPRGPRMMGPQNDVLADIQRNINPRCASYFSGAAVHAKTLVTQYGILEPLLQHPWTCIHSFIQKKKPDCGCMAEANDIAWCVHRALPHLLHTAQHPV